MNSFQFEGRPVPFQPEDTFAAALIRSGVLPLRRSLQGTPRALYCGIGLCFECEILIDGVPGRACVTQAREAAVEPGAAWRAAP